MSARTQRFEDWTLNSWGTDFSPMLFGPHDACVEVHRNGQDLVCCDMGAVSIVPLQAINALLTAHRVYLRARNPARTDSGTTGGEP